MALKDNNSSEPLLSRSERVEADGIVSIPAGPSANLISVEADPCGGIYYRIESNPPRVFQIGDEFANRNLAIIDTVRAVWILESESNRLLAVCAPPAGAPRIYLFGDLWKSFVSEQGQRSRCNDPIVLMKGAKVPALLDPKTNQLSFEVNINIHFREAFSKDAISTFQPNSSDHLINLCFDLPSGNFRRGQVFIHDRKSHGSGISYGIRGFPLVWPRPSGAPASGSVTSPPQAGFTPPPPRPATPSSSWDAPASSAEKSDSGRIKLKPRESGQSSSGIFAAAPPSSAPPVSESEPPRLKLKPRDGSQSGGFTPPPQSPPAGQRPRATQSSPDFDPGRMKLKPRDPGDSQSSSSGDSFWLSGGTVAPDPPADPPRMKLRPAGGAETAQSQNFVSGWIDDLLDDSTGPISGDAPGQVSPEGRPKSPDGQTPRKGHLTSSIQHLPIPELIERIEAESDIEVRWKMIESNLILGREERTYPLVQRYHDLIDDRIPGWPPARLRMAFGRMPGAIMVGIMHTWKVNQIMAVAEENPECEKIMAYLREREIDRMLNLQTKDEITTAEAARRDLSVDKNADAQAIKKVWRTLLGFLNADHGRQDERAIHRKKDEIAKHLQTARNILLRQK